MKKKMISILLSGLTVLSLSACNVEKLDHGVTDSRDTSTVKEQDSSDQAGESTQASDSDAKEESNPEDSTEQNSGDNGNSISGEAASSSDSFILSRWFSYDEPFYIINEKGDLQFKVEKNELKEKLGDKITDYSSVTPHFAMDGVLYISGYEYPNDQYVNYVSAIDLKTFEIKRLWESTQDGYLNYMDNYNGQVYLRVTRSDENGKASQEEVVFTKVGDSLEFTKEVTDYSKISEAAGENYINTISREDRNEYSQMAISHCLSECGYVVTTSNNVIQLIDKDGNGTEVKVEFDDYIYLNDYDKDYIVFTSRNDKGNIIYSYDVNTKETQKLIEETDSFGYLGYNNGNLYYSVDKSMEYGLQDEHIYQLNLKTGNTKHLYECKDVPGIDIGAGLEAWRIVGDSIYFAAPEQDKLNWVKVDINADQPTITDTGYSIKEINTFKYGTVEYASMEAKCADCGTVLKKEYGETFVLDGKYSANADKINTTLKSYLIDGILNAEKEVKVNSDICEEHQNVYDYVNPYQETNDGSVVDVMIMSEKYLLVDISGYWYGGGAHGMPWRGQYVFDLETGEEMRLKDFYKGSENDFRELVAKKTKEDFESYGENGYPPYFAETAEDVYQQAKEIASIDTTRVEFREECAYIIYYPYEMGPYASGYIEIPVSYEELLGRSAL